MKSWFRASLVMMGLLAMPFAAGAQAISVTTTLAPPAPLRESPPPSPGPGFVWVSGYWDWNGTDFNWVAGHWDRPPHDDMAWAPPQWLRAAQGYRFQPGYWRPHHEPPAPQQGPLAVGVPVTQAGMPAYRPEAVMGSYHNAVIPANPYQAVPVQPQPQVQPHMHPSPTVLVAPAPPPRPRFERRMRARGQVWVPGYWAWNGNQYIWTEGRLMAAPQPGARWREPRWVQRDGQWLFVPGRWR